MNSKKLLSVSGFLAFIAVLISLGQAGPVEGEDEGVVYLPAVLKHATPTLTPTPSPMPTPTSTATPVPSNTGNIVVVHIHYDGAGSAEPDEYVEIRNEDSHTVQLLNWTLRDNANHVFTFPNFVIVPGQTCRVYTNQSYLEWCAFNYSSGSAIWNNTGDCAFLRDASNTLVNQYCYP